VYVSPALDTVDALAALGRTPNERPVFRLRADEASLTTNTKVHQAPTHLRELAPDGCPEPHFHLRPPHSPRPTLDSLSELDFSTHSTLGDKSVQDINCAPLAVTIKNHRLSLVQWFLTWGLGTPWGFQTPILGVPNAIRRHYWPQAATAESLNFKWWKVTWRVFDIKAVKYYVLIKLCYWICCCCFAL